MSIGELCDHIVTMHHNELRQAFVRIEALLATVVRVHGTKRPQLLRLQDAFRELRAALEPHLTREEELLFPACREIERNGEPIDDALLAEHEREHATTGDALKALRALGDDYDPGSALCNTHRALLAELAVFERDMHQHVHEENNILMPRVRELGQRTESARSSAWDTGSLPRCCQAWIAEQSHSWALNRSMARRG